MEVNFMDGEIEVQKDESKISLNKEETKKIYKDLRVFFEKDKIRKREKIQKMKGSSIFRIIRTRSSKKFALVFKDGRTFLSIVEGEEKIEFSKQGYLVACYIEDFFQEELQEAKEDLKNLPGIILEDGVVSIDGKNKLPIMENILKAIGYRLELILVIHKEKLYKVSVIE